MERKSPPADLKGASQSSASQHHIWEIWGWFIVLVVVLVAGPVFVWFLLDSLPLSPPLRILAPVLITIVGLDIFLIFGLATRSITLITGETTVSPKLDKKAIKFPLILAWSGLWAIGIVLWLVDQPISLAALTLLVALSGFLICFILLPDDNETIRKNSRFVNERKALRRKIFFALGIVLFLTLLLLLLDIFIPLFLPLLGIFIEIGDETLTSWWGITLIPTITAVVLIASIMMTTIVKRLTNLEKRIFGWLRQVMFYLGIFSFLLVCLSVFLPIFRSVPIPLVFFSVPVSLVSLTFLVVAFLLFPVIPFGILAFDERQQRKRQKEFERRMQEASSAEEKSEICEETEKSPFFEQETYPERWAQLQDAWGTSRREETSENWPQNIKEAIKNYQNALEIYDSSEEEPGSKFWQRAASTYFNLANTIFLQFGLSSDPAGQNPSPETRKEVVELFTQSRSKRQGNMIDHYREASHAYSPHIHPREAAIIQYNLAVTQLDQIEIDRSSASGEVSPDKQKEWDQKREYALNRCKKMSGKTGSDTALEETESDTALKAMALHTKGRIEGMQDDDEARRQQRDSFEEAEQHYYKQRDDYKELLAALQSDMGIRFSSANETSEGDDKTRAKKYLNQALEVLPPENYPERCYQTAYALGMLHYEQKEYGSALSALKKAHKALENLRGQLKWERDKRKLARNNVLLYERLVHCCLKMKKPDDAFGYVAAAKGRVFVDRMASDGGFDFENYPKLKGKLIEIQRIRQQTDDLVGIELGERGLGAYAKHFSERGKRIEMAGNGQLSEQIRGAIRKERGNLQMAENEAWEAIIKTFPDITSTEAVPPLPAEQACSLAGKINATLVEYYAFSDDTGKRTWYGFVVTPDEITPVELTEVENHLDCMKSMILGRFPQESNNLYRQDENRFKKWDEAVLSPLLNKRSTNQGDNPSLIVLAPFGELHNLPMGTSYTNVAIYFVPSLGALQATWKSWEEAEKKDVPQEKKLLSIVYPGRKGEGNFLSHAEPEAEQVIGYFDPNVTQLHGREPKRNKVIKHTKENAHSIIHIICHGGFDPSKPEHSCLMLPEPLTVRDMITSLSLRHVHMLAISACVSGRTVVEKGDELVGLAQAGIAAGAKVVIASLWHVEDTSTRALFECFFSEIGRGLSPAQAMHNARQQVQKSWTHPYFWAPFQVYGLANAPLPMWREIRKQGSGSEQSISAVNDFERICRERGIGITERRTAMEKTRSEIIGKAQVLLENLAMEQQGTSKPLDDLNTTYPGVVDIIDSSLELFEKAKDDAARASLANLVIYLVETIEQLQCLLPIQCATDQEGNAETRFIRRTFTEEYAESEEEWRGKGDYSKANLPALQNIIRDLRPELEKYLPEKKNARQVSPPKPPEEDSVDVKQINEWGEKVRNWLKKSFLRGS